MLYLRRGARCRGQHADGHTSLLNHVVPHDCFPAAIAGRVEAFWRPAVVPRLISL
jgi:hypothetical protein